MDPTPKTTYGVWDPEAFEIFHKITDLALQYMAANFDTEEPIVRFKTPEELRQLIDLPIREEGVPLKNMLQDIQSILRYSVRTGHIRFFNQLWAGTDKAAVVGEWLTTLMNTSMYTYEVSPVFTLMELDILEKLRKLIGWQDGDGVFAPGGANCNLLAVLAARNQFLHHIKKEGLKPEDRLVCFTSEHAHYTIKRACSVVGIGFDGCVKVKVDPTTGKMIPSELEKAITTAISEGKKPFLVSATAGTTVLGTFDPLREIAGICKKYNIWMHVDAAWGGYALLSPKWRHLMDGVELAHSVTWTGTKCLGLPQQCSVVVLSKQAVLYNCNAMHEDYLFHEHEEKEYDLGDKTLNCGRRVDSMKLWLAWKVAGDKGFAERVDHAFDQAAFLSAEIKRRSDRFRLLVEPEALNVCFFFVPPSARSLPEDSEARKQAMGKATAVIRRKMQREGKVLFNYSDLANVEGHFFRMITCNPHATHQDMLFLLDETERLGAEL